MEAPQEVFTRSAELLDALFEALCHARTGFPLFASITSVLAFFGCVAFAAMVVYEWYEERCDFAEARAAVAAAEAQLQRETLALEAFKAAKTEELREALASAAAARKEMVAVNSKVARSVAFCRQVRAMNARLYREGQQLAEHYEAILDEAQVAVTQWTRRRDQLLQETKDWEAHLDSLRDRVAATNDAHAEFAEATKQNVVALTAHFKRRYGDNEREAAELLSDIEQIAASNDFLHAAMEDLWRDADGLQGQLLEQEDYIGELAAFAFDDANSEDLREVDGLLHDIEVATEEAEARREFIRDALQYVRAADVDGEFSSDVDDSVADTDDANDVVAHAADPLGPVGSANEAAAFVAYMKNKYALLHVGAAPSAAVSDAEADEVDDDVKPAAKTTASPHVHTDNSDDAAASTFAATAPPPPPPASAQPLLDTSFRVEFTPSTTAESTPTGSAAASGRNTPLSPFVSAAAASKGKNGAKANRRPAGAKRGLGTMSLQQAAATGGVVVTSPRSSVLDDKENIAIAA